MRVLITGVCGWTAHAIVAAVVAADHDAYGFDLSPMCIADTRGLLSHLACGTIVDEEIVDAAVRGVEAVIHLAVAVGEDAYQSACLPFDVNVRGTYNVFDMARRHGIAKVILMSEAAVHLPRDGRRLDARHDWRSSPGTDHLYDVTKRLAGRDRKRLLRNVRDDRRGVACRPHRRRARAGRSRRASA